MPSSYRWPKLFIGQISDLQVQHFQAAEFSIGRNFNTFDWFTFRDLGGLLQRMGWASQ